MGFRRRDRRLIPSGSLIGLYVFGRIQAWRILEQDGDLLMTNSDDVSFLTRPPLIDAYLETCVALMVLRIPEVQDLVSAGPPEAVVSTSYAAENLVIPVRGMLESMRAEGLNNVESLQHSFRQTNRIFLGAMWDALRQHRRFDEIKTEPVVRFFRQVRNACSHDGRLNFGKLEHPAIWRDKEITESMRGTPVFPDLLQDGDPILLVVDINNDFFEPINI